MKSKKSRTYPWNLPKRPSTSINYICFMVWKSFHICILGYLGHVPGVIWKFLFAQTNQNSFRASMFFWHLISGFSGVANCEMFKPRFACLEKKVKQQNLLPNGGLFTLMVMIWPMGSNPWNKSIKGRPPLFTLNTWFPWTSVPTTFSGCNFNNTKDINENLGKLSTIIPKLEFREILVGGFPLKKKQPFGGIPHRRWTGRYHLPILLMEGILHHLGCIKPCK